MGWWRRASVGRLCCFAITLVACSSTPDAAAPVNVGGGSGEDSGTGAAPVNVGGGSGGDSGTEAAPDPAGSDWAEVRSSFGVLSTIAGAGKSDDGNEWKPSFEGGPATAAELSRPHMAMADSDGNVYIADKEGHGIRKVSPDGTIRTVAGTSVAGNAPDSAVVAVEGALSNPNGLWVKPDGTFYILDLDNAKIRRVGRDGQMTTLFALDSIPVGRGLWVSADESEAFVAAGTRLMHWSASKGAAVYADGFSGLGMVIKTADGGVLVGDREGHRVYVVASDGTKTPVAGNGKTGVLVEGQMATLTPVEEPRAVWPYAGGMLVGLHNACKLLYVDNLGAVHVLLRGTSRSHAGDGQQYDPTAATIGEMRSVTVTPAGDILFVEGDAGFVRVLRASNARP